MRRRRDAAKQKNPGARAGLDEPPVGHAAGERAQCAKRRWADKRNFITLLFARPARDRPHHPRAHSARSEPPRASLLFSGMLPRLIRQPDARQRPRESFAHEPRSRGGRRIPRGRMRSMGGTQLSWWETTYPPRLSARRQTTTTSRLTPEPRARRPRRRRRCSLGRRPARPPRPPIRESACRGTQCPGLQQQSGCQGACGPPPQQISRRNECTF